MNLRHFWNKIAVLILILLILSQVDGKGKTEKSKDGRVRKYSGRCKSKILAEYELAFHGNWSEENYPRMFPKYRPPAQWSKLIGRSHSDKYTMWKAGEYATEAVQQFAEDSDTAGFDVEAQAYGGVRDSFTAAPIRGGQGKTATNFVTDGDHTQMSFMVKLIPSPDWFVGVSSFDLCEKKRWKSHIKIDLYPVDAGTDRGLTFTSPNWPARPRERIYMLSPTAPAHAASSFYYVNMTSLPPIAKVYLTKISEYRRKGSAPIPPKQNNLVIFNQNDSLQFLGMGIASSDHLLTDGVRNKDTRRNEIVPPPKPSTPDNTSGCLVSEWSPWTPCSATCGYGRQERRRSIVRRALQTGHYCPVLREDRTCGTSARCSWEAFKFLNRNS